LVEDLRSGVQPGGWVSFSWRRTFRGWFVASGNLESLWTGRLSTASRWFRHRQFMLRGAM